MLYLHFWFWLCRLKIVWRNWFLTVWWREGEIIKFCLSKISALSISSSFSASVSAFYDNALTSYHFFFLLRRAYARFTRLFRSVNLIAWQTSLELTDRRRVVICVMRSYVLWNCNQDRSLPCDPFVRFFFYTCAVETHATKRRKVNPSQASIIFEYGSERFFTHRWQKTPLVLLVAQSWIPQNKSHLYSSFR